MNFELIQDQASMQAWLDSVQDCPLAAIDTEFVRERSLYPHFGLLQVFDGQQGVLIDPVAMTNLQPLWDWLAGERTLILHAFNEDLELFWHHGRGLKLHDAFDTQVACAFLGWGNGVGFAAMVERLFDVSLDKSSARTDWMARPLSEKQLEYAADDVRYLFPAYHELISQLQEKGLLELVKAESHRLATRERSVAPEQRYLDVKGAWQLSPKQLHTLRHLAQWRWQRASDRDMGLGFVIKDTALLAIARYQPAKMEQLRRLTDITPQELRIHGKTLLRLVAEVEDDPEDLWPERILRVVDVASYKQKQKRIAALVEQAAGELDIPASVLASKRMINQYMMWQLQTKAGDNDTPALISDWRAELMLAKLATLK